eukprot:TRINITY_DN54067_c0_g1_i1.p1 TRINITY_DN54067_c0_g1~~TRINITY_DN54067_c0_g1_i1.p1  ORF type:complete len:668 (-),score=120.43 TRINITY_DN54067_c0_g1_i1:259-2262(-)
MAQHVPATSSTTSAENDSNKGCLNVGLESPCRKWYFGEEVVLLLCLQNWSASEVVLGLGSISQGSAGSSILASAGLCCEVEDGNGGMQWSKSLHLEPRGVEMRQRAIYLPPWQAVKLPMIGKVVSAGSLSGFTLRLGGDAKDIAEILVPLTPSPTSIPSSKIVSHPGRPGHPFMLRRRLRYSFLPVTSIDINGGSITWVGPHEPKLPLQTEPYSEEIESSGFVEVSIDLRPKEVREAAQEAAKEAAREAARARLKLSTAEVREADARAASRRRTKDCSPNRTGFGNRPSTGSSKRPKSSSGGEVLTAYTLTEEGWLPQTPRVASKLSESWEQKLAPLRPSQTPLPLLDKPSKSVAARKTCQASSKTASSNRGSSRGRRLRDGPRRDFSKRSAKETAAHKTVHSNAEVLDLESSTARPATGSTGVGDSPRSKQPDVLSTEAAADRQQQQQLSKPKKALPPAAATWTLGDGPWTARDTRRLLATELGWMPRQQPGWRHQNGDHRQKPELSTRWRRLNRDQDALADPLLLEVAEEVLRMVTPRSIVAFCGECLQTRSGKRFEECVRSLGARIHPAASVRAFEAWLATPRASRRYDEEPVEEVVLVADWKSLSSLVSILRRTVELRPLQSPPLILHGLIVLCRRGDEEAATAFSASSELPCRYRVMPSLAF